MVYVQKLMRKKRDKLTRYTCPTSKPSTTGRQQPQLADPSIPLYSSTELGRPVLVHLNILRLVRFQSKHVIQGDGKNLKKRGIENRSLSLSLTPMMKFSLNRINSSNQKFILDFNTSFQKDPFPPHRD